MRPCSAAAGLCPCKKVGVYYGASMCAFAAANAQTVRYVGVDTWQQFGAGGGRAEAAHNAEYCPSYRHAAEASAFADAAKEEKVESAEAARVAERRRASSVPPLITLLQGDCWAVAAFLVAQASAQGNSGGGGGRSRSGSSSGNSSNSGEGLSAVQHVVAVHAVADTNEITAANVHPAAVEAFDGWARPGSSSGEVVALGFPVDIFHFDGMAAHTRAREHAITLCG